MATSSARLVLICGVPASGNSLVSSHPKSRAHFETWATIFQPAGDEEMLLFDKPVAESRGG
jgi:hypothetical protein